MPRETESKAHLSGNASRGSLSSTPPTQVLSAGEEDEDIFLRRMIGGDDDAPDVKGPAPGLVPPSGGLENDISGLLRNSMRYGSHAALRSPYNGVLETSQAILENMAADTAASVASNRRTPEAVRLSPSSAPNTSPSPMVKVVTEAYPVGGAAPASSRLKADDLTSPNTNAMIRRQASFVSNGAPRADTPEPLVGDVPAPHLHAAVFSDKVDAPLATTPGDGAVSKASPTSPNAFAARSVSETLTAAEAAAGAGVMRRCYMPRKMPLPGETYDANHDLQQLFAKLNAEDLTRANRLNDDEEEDEMNTVLYNLKGTVTASSRRPPRPSEIPLPPTPDLSNVKQEPGTAVQTPLVPFQTWRFPNLGGKTRDSLVSPSSVVKSNPHKSAHPLGISPHTHPQDPTYASLLSPVDWATNSVRTEEGSTHHQWSKSSSPTSTHHTQAPKRKDTVSPQLLRRALDQRGESFSQNHTADDTPVRPARKSVAFPAPPPRDPLSSQSLSQAYHRTFEMVCSAYERLQRLQTLNQSMRKTVVGARTSILASSANRSPAASRSVLRPAAQPAMPRGSPSLSTSLLRSSGYYSFGKRISLSHYNRQTIGEVPPFLGSMSNLHVGTTAGPGQGRERSTALDSSLSFATFLRRPTRRLSDVTVNRIKSRPLLQTTLFLQHNMATLRPSASSSQLTPHLRQSTHTAPRTSIPDAATPGSSVTGTHNVSGTYNSFLHAVQSTVTAAASDSISTSAPPANGTSSSLNGRTSNSSQVTFLEVDALAEACDAVHNQQIHRESSSRTVHDLVGSRTDVSPAAPTGLRRALTEAGELQRHIHTIDEIEREVDNENGDLVVHVGMLLMGWLEVVSLLGCGSFGQVFLCKDLRVADGHFVHPADIDGEDFAYWNCCHAYLPFGDCDNPPTHDPLVAVKVVKSVPVLENQSVLEAEMLVLIGAQTATNEDEEQYEYEQGAAGVAKDPQDPFAASGPAAAGTGTGTVQDPPEADPRCQYVTKVLADGVCYGHHCIVMERYGANLYEYVERNDHKGLPMYQIRSVGLQLFSALTLLHDRCHIIHADIKPENMLLTLDSCRSNAAFSRRADLTGERSNSSTTAATTATSSLSAATPSGKPWSSVALEATPMEKSLLLLGKTATSPASSVVQTSNGVVMEKMHMLAPQPVRVQALNHPASCSPSPASGLGAPQERRRTMDGGRDAASAGGPNGASAAPKPPAQSSRLQVKLIDFSSSCYDGGPFYTYIQSRYYRAPEVIVGGRYGSGIDLWSAGCLLAELLLGIPLLPGCNDHHQLTLVEQTVGTLPLYVLQGGSQTMQFYNYDEPATEGAANEESTGTAPQTGFRLVDRDEYFQRAGTEPMEYRQFFTHNTLQELVRHCPLSLEERRMSNGLPPYASSAELAGKETLQPVPNQSTRAEIMKQRFHLFDLLRGLLNPDPHLRITATQALQHPFFTTEWAYLHPNGLA